MNDDQTAPNGNQKTAAGLGVLAEDLEGELRIDENHRRLYATDASIYAQYPAAVAFPRSSRDLVRLVRFAATTNSPLIPRAAGTSLAGQCVGAGLVVDTGRFLNKLKAFDREQREICVQPGVVQDELNRHLAAFGFLFGPDTATSNRAMIGGMIGNNSCGNHSILYGTTRDHVNSVDAVLSCGSEVTFEAWDGPTVERLLAGSDRIAELVRGLKAIVLEHQAAIETRFPHPEIRRRNTGYALDYLLSTVLVDPAGAPLNLARFLCGSEGTLAFVSEARLNVEPLPAASGILVAHFDTLAAALTATVLAVEASPSAVELIDKKVLDLTIDQLEQRKNRFFIEGDPEAILIIEFYRDSVEALNHARDQLAEALGQVGGCYACPRIEDHRVSRVWSLRKAGLGLLMGLRGDAKPVAFCEDTAVRVQDLPSYIAKFEALMARHETDCVYYGHASVGELHLRPVLNLKDPDDVERLQRIAEEVADLVAEYRGALSGEHGDGRVRSPYLSRVLGDELVEAFSQVKRLFDPDGIFNPGKIVNPLPVTEDLRTARQLADRRAERKTEAEAVETIFDFSLDGGILGHVERCNGAGVCRKLSDFGGTMCPSYRATREEMHATRGRANIFRELLLTGNPQTALTSPELKEALDLCLACKGCKAECPASVDMAKLKSEFLQHYQDQHGTSLGTRLVANAARLNALGGRFPRLTNTALTGPLSGLTKRIMGFHPAVELPALSKTTLRRWFKRRTPLLDPARAHTEVAIFADEFTNAHDLEVGQHAVEVLEVLGFRVTIPDHVDSGRPYISKGLLRQARDRAEENVRRLHPIATAGRTIVGLEPSAALTLVDEYPELVKPELQRAARDVASATLLWEDLLASHTKERDLSTFFDDKTRRILLHGHCHQEALVGVEGAVAALSIPTGHEVSVIKSGCCGMAGSFGYERAHYELSMQIGEQSLFPAVREAKADEIIATAGFSCRHQLARGTDRVALHPATVLYNALANKLIKR